MELVSRWFKSCIESHSDCSITHEPVKMPTRLLELGVPTPEHVRLSSTAATGTTSAYMTLSHCWGAAKFIKLTAETFPILSEGIHLSGLPKSFQDAVVIAKKLGVKNLWIDSLCIYQDSLEDWQQEASKMGDVYKGGLCDISAAGSDDSSGGCFYTRDPRLVDPCIFNTIFSDFENDEYHIRLEDYIEDGLHDDQTLFSRGWIVQERVLPARVVHFGKNQVFWECKSNNSCETYPAGITMGPSGPLSDGSVLTFSDYFGSLKTWNLDSGTSEELCAVWAQLVRVYSQCNLTRGSDKLVAIGGMAKEMNRALGPNDRYLAGIWSGNILYQLLWYHGSDGAASTGTRPEAYRAPSWSWASMDGVIDIDLPGPSPNLALNFHVTVRDVHIEQVTDDPFGQIREGFIRFCGPLVTLELEKSGDALSWAHGYNAVMNGLCIKGRLYPEMDLGDERLPFLHFMPFHNSNLDGSQFVGLLLQPTGLVKGQFRRCGRLKMFERAVKLAGGPLWRDVKNHDWLEYESVDGEGRYIISVI